MTGSYNGFTGKQREKKLRALKKLHAEGIHPGTEGPCQLCNDPDVPVEPHSEDYSEPFGWEPPAVYALCRRCHRHYLHQRFKNPQLWAEFVQHVKRGGYAREFSCPEVKKERNAYRKAVAKGEPYRWKLIAGRVGKKGGHWWNKLSCDPD